MSKYLTLLSCFLVFLFSCFLVLFGCANPIEDFRIDAKPNFQHDTQVQKGMLGIALSGGGLRSSAFAFGALKTLFDENILDEVDIISTVSGGGYTGYEMFVNEMYSSTKRCNSSTRFGEATYGEAAFNQVAYAQYYTANFVNFGDAWPAILPFYTLINVYDKQIKRKFGYNETNQGIRIGDFVGINTKFKVPELVVNTTFLDPWPKNFSQDIYEFTFSKAGSEERGFELYNNPRGPLLSQLVAIPGAATKPLLKQKLTDPTTFSNDDITLPDGGHSENLGAFSLIKRGIETVIIIDAEHDPEYTFEGYHNLKKRLEYWGYSIQIKDIEKYEGKKKRNLHVPYPFLKGKAKTPNGEEITIVYLKAINSDYVKGIYNQQMVDDGQVIRDDNRSLLDANKTSTGSWDSTVLDGKSIDYDALFANHL